LFDIDETNRAIKLLPVRQMNFYAIENRLISAAAAAAKLETISFILSIEYSSGPSCGKNNHYADNPVLLQRAYKQITSYGQFVSQLFPPVLKLNELFQLKTKCIYLHQYAANALKTLLISTEVYSTMTSAAPPLLTLQDNLSFFEEYGLRV
jgi:hypothetical protein